MINKLLFALFIILISLLGYLYVASSYKNYNCFEQYYITKDTNQNLEGEAYCGLGYEYMDSLIQCYEQTESRYHIKRGINSFILSIIIPKYENINQIIDQYEKRCGWYYENQIKLK